MAINFDNVVIEPGSSLRVLGLYIDSKLRWGPHIAQLKARAATQTRAISCIAGSTWGGTLEKCRLVYSMVVRLMLTFAAPIWHQPKGTSEASNTPARTLAVIPNQCLRTVLGACKATPVQPARQAAETDQTKANLPAPLSPDARLSWSNPNNELPSAWIPDAVQAGERSLRCRVAPHSHISEICCGCGETYDCQNACILLLKSQRYPIGGPSGDR